MVEVQTSMMLSKEFPLLILNKNTFDQRALVLISKLLVADDIIFSC